MNLTEAKNNLKEVLEMLNRGVAISRIKRELIGKSNRGKYLWPLRVALSGLQASPGPFEIMDVLGRKESTKRIKIALKKLA
jgi:glutamyl/glutaminyl-tRNA synthetase